MERDAIKMIKEDYKEQLKQELLLNTVTTTTVTLKEIYYSLRMDIQNSISTEEEKEMSMFQLNKAFQEVLYELVGEIKIEPKS